MTIIGLAGTLNAGKDSLGDLLARDFGFMHVSTSDMIREMKRAKYGDSPEALLTRNDPFIKNLRDQKGPGFLIDAISEDWESKKDQFPGGWIASGIRAIGEAERIHELGGIIVFVDADPSVRYKRSQARQRDANESGRTFEEFIATERTEINVDPKDKSVTNLMAMKEMADIIIDNDFSTIEEFKNFALTKLKAYL